MTAHDIYSSSAHAICAKRAYGQSTLWVTNGCTTMSKALTSRMRTASDRSRHLCK